MFNSNSAHRNKFESIFSLNKHLTLRDTNI